MSERLAAPPEHPPFETFLHSLPGADRDALLRSGHRRTWRRGELILRVGERADHAIVLSEGFVKVLRKR